MKWKRKIVHHIYTRDHSRYSKNITKQGIDKKTNHQKYKCKECGKFFTETSGTFFYYKHLSRKKIIHICRLLSQGYSFSKISKRKRCHNDTVRKYINDLVIWHHFNRSDLFNFLSNECKLRPFEIVNFLSNLKTKKRIKEIIIEDSPFKSRRGEKYTCSVNEFEETIDIIMNHLSKKDPIASIQSVLKDNYLSLKSFKLKTYHEKLIRKTLDEYL